MRAGYPRGSRTQRRAVLALQLAATATVLGWLPGSAIKLLTMVPIWWLGFGEISGRELAVMAGVDALFSLMDLGALQSGVFRFLRPDLLGLPIYEFFMWGFFALQTLRFIGRAPPTPRFAVSLVLAAFFAVPFATVTQPTPLFVASASILLVGLAILRDPTDFAYAGYMIAIGCVIEYVGVWTGQWEYPGSPPGGVALWFIPMWGGVGLFTGRLLAPLLYPPSVRAPAEQRRA